MISSVRLNYPAEVERYVQSNYWLDYSLTPWLVSAQPRDAHTILRDIHRPYAETAAVVDYTYI